MALNDVTKNGYTNTDYTTIGFHGTRWENVILVISGKKDKKKRYQR